MAGNGPAPKDRRSRSRDQSERTQLQQDNTNLRIVRGTKYFGPDLPKGPEVLPNGEDWHPLTRRWWNHWRRSPQASRMLSDPDWDFLLDTALMHHIMWSKGKWEYASEIRIRVAKFGATVEDRLRLKSEIEVPPTTAVGTGPGATVTSIQDRRSRMAD
ncbi:phage terminase small subunit [Kocuria sp.]|uniref:phage terminase small subunit n=1 Tax=Kocuria sp. TaxID=1871328 RepID=UPI0026DF09B7|nr:hypothetical protein [Kocuria sp.]MDO5619283.1 hypothetical protein [Kocuria sp.]